VSGTNARNKKGVYGDKSVTDTNNVPGGRFGAARNHNGNYGTLGIPNESNMPPSRRYPLSWTDFNGNFWLFGG
jgi:hypothetical protein